MAQAQLDVFNDMPVDQLRDLILMHSTDAERFKELYQQRNAIRVQMQQSLGEVKKLKRVLRAKLALECKNRKATMLPSTTSAGPVGENRSKRSLENAFGKTEIDFSKYKNNKKSKKMQKVVNPKNEGLGYFLITKNNFKVFSPTYPTIAEFGHIRSIEPATKEALEVTFYTTLQDYLSSNTCNAVVECMKPKPTATSDCIPSIKSTEKDSELFSDTDTDDE